MKKTIMRITKALLLIAVVFSMGCDDGQLRLDAADASKSPPIKPIIVSFTADPKEVEPGGTTTITWQVANADSIEITSTAMDGSSPVHIETTELEGSTAATGLTATTDFTITATVSAESEVAATEGEEGEEEVAALSISAAFPKSEDVEDEEGDTEEQPIGDESLFETPEGEEAVNASTTATETITVYVIEARDGPDVTISADKENLFTGESTIVRWSVYPDDSTVEVTDSDGVNVEPTFAGEDCNSFDPSELLDIGTPMETPATEGCAVVSPQTSTVYTVTGTDAEGVSGNSDITINVGDADIKAEIRVNGSKEALTRSFADPVNVTWTAEPAGSLVTITANPAPTSCTPELPQGQVVDYSSAECTVEGETQFSIRVEAADDASQSAEDTAHLKRDLSGSGAGVNIRANEWAFAGEEIEMEIQVREDTDPSLIRELLIRSYAGIQQVKIPSFEPVFVKVKVPMGGVDVTLVDVSGNEIPQGTPVRTLTTLKEDVTAQAEAITKMTFDVNDATTRFVGVQMPGWNDGKIRMYKNGADIDILFGNPLMAHNGLTGLLQDPDGSNNTLAKFVKTFPVNAISVRPGQPNEIYVGTTGAIMYSKDGGATFDLFESSLRVNKKGSEYSGSHQTCRGETQTGVKTSGKNKFASLNQICDVVATEGGRLLVATDLAIYAIDDAAKYLEDTSIQPVKGANTFGRVNDDIECVDGECITAFAATDGGVIKTVDGGATWTDFGTTNRAYKVLVLGNKVYAATESDVVVSDMESASWESMGLGQGAKSLAIDKNIAVNDDGTQRHMLLAGTATGVHVTRDSGANWSPIDVATGAEIRDVAIETTPAVGGGNIVTVLIGSGNNAIYGQAPVNIVGTTPSAPPEDAADAMLEAGMDADIVAQYISNNK